MTRKNVWLGIGISLGVPLVVLASNLVTPHAFTPSTTISSAQMNANFAAVQTAVNTRKDVYGDGSNGAWVVATGAIESWAINPPPNSNLQFQSLTVPATSTLRVNSGSVIRVTGNVDISGTIEVSAPYNHGYIELFSGSATDFKFQAPRQGISQAPPIIGQRVIGAGNVGGGLGGVGAHPGGLRANLAIDMLDARSGGGGGAPCFFGGSNNFGGTGSDGAGALTIIAGGTITIGFSGSIQAAGGMSGSPNPGGGGGGGGIIVLASKTSINVVGVISANGDSGGPSSSSSGPGGGGGGGIVQLLAPMVTNTGIVDVAGGAAGTQGAPGSATGTVARMGGGGGGASVGSGGAGGSITGMDPGAAGAGIAGVVLTRLIDPTNLL